MNPMFVRKVLVPGLVVVVILFLGLKMMQAPAPQGGDKPPEPPKPTTRQVLRAKVDLMQDQAIKADQVEMCEKPVTELDPLGTDVCDTISVALGQWPKGEMIPKGDLILKSKLTDKMPITKISEIIPKGKRAMTIAVDQFSGVGGFLKQGDFVDVIGVFPDRPVQTILPGVLILAVGFEYRSPGMLAAPKDPKAPPPPPGSPGAEEGPGLVKANQVPVVTAAVTREEGEVLTMLAEKAKFRLALRSKGDKLDEGEHSIGKEQALTMLGIKDPVKIEAEKLAAEKKAEEAAAKAAASLATAQASQQQMRPAAPPKKRELSVEIYKGTNKMAPVTVPVVDEE